MIRKSTALWLVWPAIVLFLVFAAADAVARDGRGGGSGRSDGSGGHGSDDYRWGSDSGGSGHSHGGRFSTQSRDVNRSGGATWKSFDDKGGRYGAYGHDRNQPAYSRDVHKSYGARPWRYFDDKGKAIYDDKGDHSRSHGYDHHQPCYNCHSGKEGLHNHFYGHKHKFRPPVFYGGYSYSYDRDEGYDVDTPPPPEPVNVGKAISASDFASLPCAAEAVPIGGATYFVCGTSWFTRVLEAGEVFYVVVPPPPRYYGY